MAQPIIRIDRLHSAAIVYFEAVRQHGTMRGAARALNVASPAVNRQILKIEELIGTPLFERLPKGLELTAAGEAFARHTMTVMQDCTRTAREIENLFGIQRGAISLIVAEGLVSGFLPQTLAEFQARYPQVEIDVTTAGSHLMPEAVGSGRVDLAVAYGLRHSDALVRLDHCDLQLGALVAADHPLAERRSVSLRACVDYPLVMAQGTLAIDSLLAPYLDDLGQPLRIGLKTNSIELMRTMAAAGSHVMFSTVLGFEADIASGRLVHVPLQDGGGVRATLGIFARAGRTLPPAANRLSRALGERLAQLRADATDVT